MATRIDAISTTDGFLKNARIHFHGGLTCVIGTRGTCKSTIVETLRFALSCDENRVNELIEESSPLGTNGGPCRRGLIRSTLSGGVAKCEITHAIDGTEERLTVEREVGGESRIYREGIQELSDSSALNCAEIYSQGDLQAIAENESLRLELIDRPNKQLIEQLSAEREVIFRELREIGTEARTVATEVETRRADVRALDPLRLQLADLQSSRPQLSPELDEERAAAVKRKATLDATRTALQGKSEVKRELQRVLSHAASLAAPPADLALLDEAPANMIFSEWDRFASLIISLRNELNQQDDGEVEAAVATLLAKNDELNARYVALRQEQLDVNESLKREDVLKQQIGHLEKLQAELDALVEKHSGLILQRRRLRGKLREICDRIYSFRQREVDLINEVHGDVILLTLHQGVQSAQYERRIMDLLQGSRLRAQDEVARDLSRNVPPAELIDIVEESAVQRLSQLLTRDAGQMTRLIAHLSDKKELYLLEANFFEDRLEITMYDHNIAKPVNQLSKGQMATALLPLILRPANYPLIFDQPEDDLDNSFIYETLVKQIQKLKISRQLIFVTHNANIPVLGEADKVIVMEMENPRTAKTPEMGTVDDVKFQILSLLEGGAEAFLRRQEKYKPLL